jgi:chemotaxis protein MotB
MAGIKNGRRKKNNGGENGPSMERWLLTYADLITLLMIFFVVMYSISNINAQKMQAVASSLSQVLAGKAPEILDFTGPAIIEGQSGAQHGDVMGQAELEAARLQLVEYLKILETMDPGISKNIVIMQQERGLVISLKDTLLFPKGSAELTPRARQVISGVGKSLAELPNYTRVEGHTDNLPIHTAQFPSNWELSVIRATNVAQQLINEGSVKPEKISATGYGEYRPLVPNNSVANRAINRRVDIVILKHKYSYFEPAPEETAPL